MAYTADERKVAIEKVVDGLRRGIPLTIICSEEGMPCDRTIRDWADADDGLSSAIARAREAGFDQIAVDALAIADTPARGVIRTTKPDGKIEEREEDMLGHRKLQVETRLKLLAKWDPKRYGDATTVKHADADGEKIDLDPVARATRLAAIAASLEKKRAAGEEDVIAYGGPLGGGMGDAGAD